MKPVQALALLGTCLVVLAAGCARAAPPADASPTPSPTRLPDRQVQPTASPSPPATASLSATPVPATAVPDGAPSVCSPLEGYPIAQLSDIVVNPFSPPRWGSDEAHQGVDLADLQSGNRIALPGRTVQAALDGRVAAVVVDRFPYGNAVLVESSLEGLPQPLPTSLALPTPAPTLGPHPALTCPEPEPTPGWDPAQRSLYLLYAHLLEPATVAAGDAVTCGQTLGAIGASGNALNPHLHLEARIGPAGASFESLAHYTPRATEGEMAAYCLWRVSGWFQPVDPGGLFQGE